MTTVFGPAFDGEWRQRFQRFAERCTTEADVSGWSALGLSRRVEAFSGLLDSIDLAPASVVLDVGCGAGTYSRLLSRRGHRVVGLDYSLPSLGRAMEYDPERACRYVAADGYALPFPPGSFDLIVCIGVLQAVATPERVVKEAARVLRRGAVLIVEGLNARAVAAHAGRLHARLKRLPPRVRHYDPRRVEEWLVDHDLRLVARAPIVIPPRQLPSARWVLDLVPVPKAALGGSPLIDAVAHSFFFAARKAGPSR